VALGSDTEGVVPARPPDRVTLSEVVRVFEPRGPDLGPDRDVEQAVERALARFSEAGHGAVAGLSFRSLLGGTGGDERE
jgi:DNA-binding IscR family transcriptional regulator